MVYTAVTHTVMARGLAVPGNLSLASYTSAWEVMPRRLPISGVMLPEPKMAVSGVSRLLRLIGGESAASPAEPIVGEFVAGQTTGPAPDESRR